MLLFHKSAAAYGGFSFLEINYTERWLKIQNVKCLVNEYTVYIIHISRFENRNKTGDRIYPQIEGNVAYLRVLYHFK